jgi:two-component system sensor histidine kinase KdpD
MNNDHRPTPEALLLGYQQDQRQQAGGQLTIFLGAAPGVGKTYAMLTTAITKRAEGLDVVAGLVETHGRPETQALLAELEVLPRRSIDYHGHQLEEFDLDAALTRRPALLLVDELAHSNVPGCRHAKRWQDVQELLAHGIDVYTTLNIQHLESLNDVIAQITGVIVRETVPDAILEQTGAVELVDLPPEELLRRLQEGKVYVPQLVGPALEHFFRPANLAALRELALRTTAEQVNVQVRSFRDSQSVKETWPTAERLLVCIGPDPGAARLIRATRRMAARLQAPWLAVHVETPATLRLSEARRAHIIQHLRLAEQLGGETLTLSGRNVVEEILNLARIRNITRIIVGKPSRGWRRWFSKSILERLLQGSGEIDILATCGEEGEILPPPALLQHRSPWRYYFFSLLTVGFTTSLGLGLHDWLGSSNLIMLYLLGILLVSLAGRRGPALLNAILSVFSFFFLSPSRSLVITDTPYLITFTVMLIVALVISQLTVASHRQAEAARLREHRTAALHALSRQLASSRGTDTLLQIAVHHIGEVFDSQVLALLPDAQGRLLVRAGYRAEFTMDAKEQSVAQWVYDLGQMAGLGTQTLPFVDALYVPLSGKRGTVGTLRVKSADSGQLLIPEQLHLLEAFVSQTALALEVDRLQEETHRAEVQMESERLRGSLFSSVSHDLRTPLAAINSATGELLEGGDKLEPELRRGLLQAIHNQTGRLDRMINNLLQAIRLEAGDLELKREPYKLEDIINTVLHRLRGALLGRPVEVRLPPELPLLPVDERLLDQVLVNLLENAVLHTPAGSPIALSAILQDEHVLVEIADEGPGLPPEELERVFDKFYRGPGYESKGGLGLGLAICRGIIDLHGGRIWVENRPSGGAVFRFTLPVHRMEETPRLRQHSALSRSS